MKLGILSDTHDRFDTVRLALEQFRQRSVEMILHCGDIESADTVRLFAGTPTHFVFGNCDWQPEKLRYAIAEVGATLHEPFGELEVCDKKIGFVHSHIRALFQELQSADRFDYLFYGHTHVAEQHQVGKTLVVNPGALQRARDKTCAVLDVTTGDLETIPVTP
jgi:putative phosphoesterase